MVAVRRVAAWLRGRPGAILLLLGGWIAVTAAGAGRAADSSGWVGLPSAEWLVYVIFGWMVLGGILILVVAVLGGKRELPPRPERKPIWPMIILFLAVAILIRWGEWFDSGSETEVVETAERVEAEPVDAVPSPAIDRLDMFALAVLVAAAVGVLLLTRRRIRKVVAAPIDDDELLEDALPSAVDRAAEHLRLGRDARAAVMLAYDELETVLATRGEARRPTDTPSEHLGRVLANIPIDTGPLMQLARLYELARFSDQPLDDDDRQVAVDALGEIRDQLAVLR